MKLSTVAEVLASEADEPVLAIRGTLTKLFKLMTGDGQYGPWALQNGTLKDATGEIKVVFKDRAAVPDNWKGQVVELRCTKGNKGGWTGCKRINDKYKGKEEAKLAVSDKAEVILFNNEHQPEQQPPPQDTHTKPPERPLQTPSDTPRGMAPQEPPQAPTGPARGPNEAEKMAEGIAAIYQILNTQLAVISLVHEYLVPAVKARTGQTIDAQQEASLVQNCLIQMYYQKTHWNFRQKPFKIDPPNGPPPDQPPSP